MVHVPGVPPLSWLTPIITACAALAWALSLGWGGRPRWPFYRPVALLLSWNVVASLARAVLQAGILVPARAALGPEPAYPWPVRAAYVAELALRTLWPFAILAAALAVFLPFELRRRALWALPAGGLAAGALCLAYPDLRRGPQAIVEAALATACWVACAAAVWWSYARARDVWVASHFAMVPVIAAQLAVIVVVQWGGDPHEHWGIARVVQGAGYAGLLGYQAWKLRGAR